MSIPLFLPYYYVIRAYGILGDPYNKLQNSQNSIKKQVVVILPCDDWKMKILTAILQN